MPEHKQHTEVGLPDLRLPVGLFFIVTSAILLIEGLTGHPIRAGLDVDTDWGVVLLVFGMLMSFFGYRAGPEQRVVDDE